MNESNGITITGYGKPGLIARVKNAKWGSEGGPIEYKDFSWIYFSLYCLTNHSHKNCSLKLKITITSEEGKFTVEGWANSGIFKDAQKGGVRLAEYELTAEHDEVNAVQYKIELMALS